MKIKTTRTLNPLPFCDLEPHRFEDLIRQLAYSYRDWKSLEATGRGGSDDGIDIRGIERVRITNEQDDSNDDAPTYIDRLWIFQCKREKSFSSTKVLKAVKESLKSLETPPFGFILAVACDVTKASRDAFRQEMVTRGVEEFALWAKGELEDMLFQPKNDNLLFAYFNISLQTRRRSLSTTIKSEITKKKQLLALIGDESNDGKLVLLRDSTDERYPNPAEKGQPQNRWRLCRILHLKKPGQVLFLTGEHLAAVTYDRTHWDAIFDVDTLERSAISELRSLSAWTTDEGKEKQSPHFFWNEYIHEQERAFLGEFSTVKLSRILAIDMIGDGYYPIPHIFVESDNEFGPFSERWSVLRPQQTHGYPIEIEPTDENRCKIFPVPLPKESSAEPKEFDDTGGQGGGLSNLAIERLNKLAVKPVITQSGDEQAAHDSESEGENSNTAAFDTWRNNVAFPIFSSFAYSLRAAGHRARVVLRPKNPNDGRKFTGRASSIELRMQLHTPSAYNADYHQSCRVGIFGSSHGGWRTVVEPSRSSGSSSYNRGSQTPPPTISSTTTAEELEKIVLDTIERVDSSN